MIRLTRLRNLDEIENIETQPGKNQNIYRVLAIMQADDDKLYTAADIAKLGWDPVTQKEQYEREIERLHNWARKKGIYKLSDNKDENGDFLKPAKWTGFHWKEQLKDIVKKMAIDILNCAYRRQQDDIAHGVILNTYWFDEDLGVISITPVELSNTIDYANRKFFKENGIELGSLQDENVDKPITEVAPGPLVNTFQKRKVVLFILVLLALSMPIYYQRNRNVKPEWEDIDASQFSELLRENRLSRKEVELFTPELLDMEIVIAARKAFLAKQNKSILLASAIKSPSRFPVRSNYANMELDLP